MHISKILHIYSSTSNSKAAAPLLRLPHLVTISKHYLLFYLKHDQKRLFQELSSFIGNDAFQV